MRSANFLREGRRNYRAAPRCTCSSVRWLDFDPQRRKLRSGKYDTVPFLSGILGTINRARDALDRLPTGLREEIHYLRGRGMAKKKEVTERVLHDPIADRLRPIYPLDLSKIRTIDELVRGMGETAFTARQIGDATDVLEAMARDKDCFVVMTLSGAMTVAKMGLIFCDLIESGIVHAIVSTGALMAHGLVEATGRSHFRDDAQMDDRALFHAGYNRVYDSLEPEVNLDHVEQVVQHILDAWNATEVLSSWKLNRRIGEYL